MQTYRVLLATLLLATTAACTGTVGPYITDIQELPDGRLSVTRCKTQVTHSGDFVSYENNLDCHEQTLGRPYAAQAAGTGSPSAASAAAMR